MKMKHDMPKKVKTPEIAKPEKVKKSGVRIRGCGAATKGCMARGPMA